MHPPAARSAAANPMATALVVAAPAAVLELPVAQPARRTVANSVRCRDMADLPRSV
jgi:hypothetical protein